MSPLCPETTHSVRFGHEHPAGADCRRHAGRMCEGCSGLDPFAIAALLVALGALAMAWREHRVFIKRLKARARLEVTLRVVQPPGVRGGLVEIDGTAGTIIIEVGLRNYGERAAGATTVNVLFPERADVRWCGPRGEDMGPESNRSIPSGETLDVANQTEPPRAWYLTKQSPRVSLRDGHSRGSPSTRARQWAARSTCRCGQRPRATRCPRTSPTRVGSSTYGCDFRAQPAAA